MSLDLEKLQESYKFHMDALAYDRRTGQNRPRQPMFTVKPANDEDEFYSAIAQPFVEDWQRAEDQYHR